MTITWINTSGGNWSDATNWSSNPSLPGPSDDVAITLPGSYTVNLGTAEAISSLLLDDTGATLALDNGIVSRLTLTGELSLLAGTLAINGGTLAGGTVVANGGTVAFGNNASWFENLTWLGPLDATNALLDIEGTFAPRSLSDGPGTVSLNHSTLYFLDAVALDSTTLTVTGASSITGNGTLTLGSGMTVNATAPLSISDAHIASSATFNVTGSSAVLDIGVGRFSNAGTISLSNAATLEFISGVLTDAGVIDVGDTASALNVQGTITTGNIPHVTGAAGVLDVTLLDNTGTVFSVGPSDAFSSFNGDIRGGTVVNDGGAFRLGTLDGVSWLGALNLSSSGPFNIVAVQNGLTVAAMGGGSGTINLNSSSLRFLDTETIDNITINFPGGLSAGTLTLGAHAVLDAGSPGGIGAAALTNLGTVDATASFDIAGSLAPSVLADFSNSGTVSAVGSGITVDIAAQTLANNGLLQVGGGATLILNDVASATLNNAGSIVIDDSVSALVLAGTETVAQLGSISNAGGLINVTGMLDNTGNTLTLAAGAIFGNLRIGTASQLASVTGGTIVAAGGLVDFAPAALDDVAWRGPVDLSRPDQQVDFHATTSLDLQAIGGGQAQIVLTGAHSDLSFSGGGVLDAKVTLGAAGAPVSFGGASLLADGGNLTLAATTTLTTTDGSGFINIDGNITNFGLIDGESGTFNVGAFSAIPGFFVAPAIFDNQGTIIANAGSAAPFTVGDLTNLDNEGRIIVGNGEQLVIETATLSNTGTIQLATGTVDFAGPVGNAGTLAFTGANGLLQFDQPGSVTATVEGWIAGDTVALTQPGSYSLGFASGTLDVLQNGSEVAAFNVGTGYSLSSFSLDTASGNALIGIACFARGTRIATPQGELAVEHLAPGDSVLLVSGGTAPIIRIVCRRIDPAPPALHPVRIRRGAFGHDTPHRDLLLSPDHALYLDSALTPVRHLIDGAVIAQIPRHAIDYFHVELTRHDVILAEGLPVESYLAPGADAARAWEAHGCAPLIVSGTAINRARARITISTPSSPAPS